MYKSATATSMLAFTRAMIALRRASEALREGDFVALDAPEPLLAFERRSGAERVVCVFNLGEPPARWSLPAAGKRSAPRFGRGDARGHDAALGGYSALMVEV